MSLYTAIATSAGRDGRAVSSDGQLDVTLGLQKELGGDGIGTYPEQLFAAGYAACFASAMQLVSKRQKGGRRGRLGDGRGRLNANGEGASV